MINFSEVNNFNLNNQKLYESNPLLKNLTVSFKVGKKVLKPTTIKPYFFKIDDELTFEESEITVTTMITIDKFKNLFNSLSTYDGPFSVVLHLQNDTQLERNLKTFTSFINTNIITFRKRVDFHLVIDNFPKQLNFYRNIARHFTRTTLIFPLDVDFIISPKFKKNFKNDEQIMKKLFDGTSLFILPAFQFQPSLAKLKNFEEFPINKEELAKLYNNAAVRTFHGDYSLGHFDTNYKLWFSVDKMYQIEPNSYNFEPYAVFNKNSIPWSDERFVGYGSNKSSWLYEIYLSGIDFFVVPFDFIVHQHHPSSVVKEQGLNNKLIFREYVKEICVKYTKAFLNKETKPLKLKRCLHQ
ncbi:hypothetical protein HDU92_008649 [Lobulomyces angularis]|nr:hypothetical protein HDU92_008649 [Lobulomyces angularis]